MKKMLLCSLGVVSILNAQSASIGAGVGIQNNIYKDTDSNVLPIPSINYENEYMYLKTLEAGGFLFKNDIFTISVGIRGRIDGYDDAKGYMQGMKDRKYTIDGGIKLEAKTDIGNFELSGYHDLLGRYKGYNAEVSYSYPLYFQDFGVIPYIAAEYLSNDYVEYYFGVKESEVKANRPYYKGSSTINYKTGVMLYYSINESWSVHSGVDFTFFGDDIKESPIVKEDYRIRAGMGVSYKF